MYVTYVYVTVLITKHNITQHNIIFIWNKTYIHV